MDGLQVQWLRAPEAVDLVGEWEAAADVLFERHAQYASQAR
jgi:hypothetical protein